VPENILQKKFHRFFQAGIGSGKRRELAAFRKSRLVPKVNFPQCTRTVASNAVWGYTSQLLSCLCQNKFPV
jgi:hypothetical protein